MEEIRGEGGRLGHKGGEKEEEKMGKVWPGKRARKRELKRKRKSPGERARKK